MTTTETQLNQKDFSQILDKLTWKADNPASSKQVWYLAHLILTHDEKTGKNSTDDFLIGDESKTPLSKAHASHLINLYV